MAEKDAAFAIEHMHGMQAVKNSISMRKIYIIILFVASAFYCCGQSVFKKNVSNYLITGALVFAAGAADGIN